MYIDRKEWAGSTSGQATCEACGPVWPRVSERKEEGGIGKLASSWGGTASLAVAAPASEVCSGSSHT